MKEDINKYSQMIISNEIVATGSWLIYSFIDYMNGNFSDELYLLRQQSEERERKIVCVKK